MKVLKSIVIAFIHVFAEKWDRLSVCNIAACVCPHASALLLMCEYSTHVCSEFPVPENYCFYLLEMKMENKYSVHCVYMIVND